MGHTPQPDYVRLLFDFIIAGVAIGLHEAGKLFEPQVRAGPRATGLVIKEDLSGKRIIIDSVESAMTTARFSLI